MPHRTWEFRIADIVEAINNVLDYTDGMSYRNFVKDRKTIDIPWRDMRDMRNILVHEYFCVDNQVVWETINKNLPPILPLLKKIIEKTA